MHPHHRSYVSPRVNGEAEEHKCRQAWPQHPKLDHCRHMSQLKPQSSLSIPQVGHFQVKKCDYRTSKEPPGTSLQLISMTSVPGNYRTPGNRAGRQWIPQHPILCLLCQEGFPYALSLQQATVITSGAYCNPSKPSTSVCFTRKASPYICHVFFSEVS